MNLLETCSFCLEHVLLLDNYMLLAQNCSERLTIRKKQKLYVIKKVHADCKGFLACAPYDCPLIQGWSECMTQTSSQEHNQGLEYTFTISGQQLSSFYLKEYGCVIKQNLWN